MKHTNRRRFISGILVTLLVVGLVGTVAAEKRQIFGDFLGTRLQINHEFIEPKDINGNPVELFAVNGTTYLPVRCVAEALGLEAGWDSIHNIVFVTDDAARFENAVNTQYQDTGVPRFELVVGYNAFYDMSVERTTRITYLYLADHFKASAADNYSKEYRDTLLGSYYGFESVSSSTVSGMDKWEVKHEQNKVSVRFWEYDSNGQRCVAITVDTNGDPAKPTVNPPTTSTPGDTKPVSRPDPQPDPPAQNDTALYEAELNQLNVAYDEVKALTAEAYRQAYLDRRFAEKKARETYGPDIPESALSDIQRDYQNDMNAIKAAEDTVKARYDADVQSLKAKYGM